MITKAALLVCLLLGGDARLEAQAQDRPSDEELVRSLDDQERTAALRRDVAALERLWSDQFVVNAPNNQVVVGKTAVLDVFVRAGVINFSSFERHVEFVRVDGAFAILMGLETVTPVTDALSAGLVAGQPVKRRFTNVWKKEGDAWRLFARHANVIPTRDR